MRGSHWPTCRGPTRRPGVCTLRVPRSRRTWAGPGRDAVRHARPLLARTPPSSVTRVPLSSPAAVGKQGAAKGSPVPLGGFPKMQVPKNCPRCLHGGSETLEMQWQRGSPWRAASAALGARAQRQAGQARTRVAAPGRAPSPGISAARETLAALAGDGSASVRVLPSPAKRSSEARS